MAVVRPFRAVRYACARGADISSLTAPPYDVVGDAQRAALLAGDPHNVVALELPDGPLDPSVPGNRYETGGRIWREWLAEGVLRQDEAPAVYVLEQRGERSGHAFTRRGFVAAVDLEPFSAGVVLPHERTLPKAIDDRLMLTRATAANLSQVFGIFADPERATGAVLERATADEPLATATDDDGVVSTVWALTDAREITTLAAALANVTVFIADGHHRYTTALAYRDERRAAAAAPVEPEGAPPAYDSIMMTLVDIAAPGLTVLATHRIADAAGTFDSSAFWAGLAEHFELEELPPGHPSDALAAAEGGTTFLVRTRDGQTRRARLREDVDHSDAFPDSTPEAWRSLDVAAVQELALRPLLGIHPDQPETLGRLWFTHDAHEALRMASEHDVAFILEPTRMDQVAAVALASETMPQKSTYFYPKLLSGLVFKRLD